MKNHGFSRLLLASVLMAAWLVGSFLQAQSVYKAIEVKGGGTIRGSVRLVGDVPKDAELEVSKDVEHCGKMKRCGRLAIGKQRGVRNAIVFLDGITQGKKIVPATRATLNQQDCEYIPHVMIVPVGTQMEIVNNDAILHNVHAYQVEDELRSLFNIAQPVKGQRTCIKQTTMKKAGIAVAMCDAGHPWMSAYIGVADHPYYTLTDENGNFTLEGVPPGEYKIKMWHEGVSIVGKDVENGKVKKYRFEEPYEAVKEIRVPDNGVATADFDLVIR